MLSPVKTKTFVVVVLFLFFFSSVQDSDEEREFCPSVNNLGYVSPLSAVS